jgi:hypothetical protein
MALLPPDASENRNLFTLYPALHQQSTVDEALHLVSAELGGADILLTTTRKFINAARKATSYIQVKNPLVWLTEVLYGR